MRELLCQEGLPEKPWVRREDDERMEGKSNLDQSANKETNETVKHQLNDVSDEGELSANTLDGVTPQVWESDQREAGGCYIENSAQI